jgi:hypothetical protein
MLGCTPGVEQPGAFEVCSDGRSGVFYDANRAEFALEQQQA